MELDKFDLAILAVLQQDARASLQDISARIGLSTTPCWTRIKKLEESLPSTKGYFSVHHDRGMWDILLRVNYYGSWYEDHLDSDVVRIEDGGLPIYEDSAVTVDIETGWEWDNGLYARVGVQNLFDKTPDDNPWGGIAGAEFPVHSPYGFGGGFYYARLGWKF